MSGKNPYKALYAMEDERVRFQAEVIRLTNLAAELRVEASKQECLKAIAEQRYALVSEVARRALQAIDNLMADSLGVAGLHKSGDIAYWDEITAGGNYEEWLLPLEDLRQFLPRSSDEKGGN